MPTQPTTPPIISDFPDAPNSVSDTPTEFDTKANNFVSAQVSYVPQANNLADWQEETTQQTYDNALEAAASAAESEDSAEESAIYAANSAGSANYIGLWSSLSGSLSKPASVLHNNTFWRLNVDLANVSASQPSPTNSDWSAMTAYNWSVINSSGNSAINSYELCKALGADITRTLPSLGAGDFLAINSSPQSTGLVLLNIPNNVTIYGSAGSLDGAVDNLKLSKGETVHLAAESTTIWRAL